MKVKFCFETTFLLSDFFFAFPFAKLLNNLGKTLDVRQSCRFLKMFVKLQIEICSHFLIQSARLIAFIFKTFVSHILRVSF